MADPETLAYSSIPERESWVIPFWDPRDRDEFEDLTSGITLKGEDWFTDAMRVFRNAVKSNDVVGVRFYVGCNLPSGITMILRPASRSQAAEILFAAYGFMGFDRGVVPWDRIAAHLWAIRDVLLADDEAMTPTFGFSAIIPDPDGRPGSYTEAPTSWLGKHPERIP